MGGTMADGQDWPGACWAMVRELASWLSVCWDIGLLDILGQGHGSCFRTGGWDDTKPHRTLGVRPVLTDYRSRGKQYSILCFRISSRVVSDPYTSQEVEEDSRGAFSTTEASWQNVFELCSYIATIILSSPDQFSYPASASVMAVLSAWLLYSRFVTQRRGHLLHWPACIPGPEKRQQSWGQVTARLQQRRWQHGG